MDELPVEERKSPREYLQEVKLEYEQCCLPLPDGSASPTAKFHSTWNAYTPPNKKGKFDNENDNDNDDDNGDDDDGDDDDGDDDDDESDDEY